MKIWELGRFTKLVEIQGSRSLSDREQALAALARPYFQWKDRGRRPFVGRVDGRSGTLWFCRRRGIAGLPGRSLRFELTENGDGCLLRGKLETILPCRIFTGFYLAFCIVMAVWAAIEKAVHQSFHGIDALKFAAAPVFGVAFMYGYTGLAVWFGRPAEELGVKVIKYLIADEASAEVVLDLIR